MDAELLLMVILGISTTLVPSFILSKIDGGKHFMMYLSIFMLINCVVGLLPYWFFAVALLLVGYNLYDAFLKKEND